MSKAIKVLIVDDESHIRALISTVITSMGGEVIAEAENGRDGVEQYKKHKPDIVMLDINMPVMDGLQALKNIIEINPDAMVIMLTSLTDIETVKTCVENGASTYIRKDISVKELKQLIKEAWQEYRKNI